MVDGAGVEVDGAGDEIGRAGLKRYGSACMGRAPMLSFMVSWLNLALLDGRVDSESSCPSGRFRELLPIVVAGTIAG